ncbi:hypothetical protein BZA05DRAFT_247340 [Tricharina praecox]|uniref:uncharacterized protein n=1 Tax=Tricharina praecox TaxID=43433 RepID=UPI00221E8804|nr:uncharacterized protein BZA05DRAFT_247340 [Tricharina praecox]KAI5854671.1 hypothetical protein BZA05DRAFT_247340 [Tricharina praecox]
MCVWVGEWMGVAMILHDRGCEGALQSHLEPEMAAARPAGPARRRVATREPRNRHSHLSKTNCLPGSQDFCWGPGGRGGHRNRDSSGMPSMSMSMSPHLLCYDHHHYYHHHLRAPPGSSSSTMTLQPEQSGRAQPNQQQKNTYIHTLPTYARVGSSNFKPTKKQRKKESPASTLTSPYTVRTPDGTYWQSLPDLSMYIHLPACL